MLTQDASPKVRKSLTMGSTLIGIEMVAPPPWGGPSDRAADKGKDAPDPRGKRLSTARGTEAGGL